MTALAVSLSKSFPTYFLTKYLEICSQRSKNKSTAVQANVVLSIMGRLALLLCYKCHDTKEWKVYFARLFY